MKTIHREIVSALLLSKDHKVLFARKNPNKSAVYNDCWHIPGGGIEENESKQAALKRELLEEVGIDISPYSVELVDDKGQGSAEKTLADTGEKVLCEMHFNVYKVQLDTNADEIIVNLSSELSEYQWVSLEQIDEIHKTPPGEEFFARFDKKTLVN